MGFLLNYDFFLYKNRKQDINSILLVCSDTFCKGKGGKPMSPETSLVVIDFRLQEWVAKIRECQSYPAGMSVAS